MATRYFGDTPAVIPQEVRASPPSPSQANVPPPAPSAQQLARRRPVRASPLIPPGTIQAGLRADSRMPVAAILQGAPVRTEAIPRAYNVNGAPIAVSTVGFAGSLANMNVDTSVSAQHRAAKALGALIADGAPVSGNYTDAIRNAAGFAFGPKRMPKQGYAAAGYSYPAQQMVVGATLAGRPIVNPAPVPASAPGAPRLVTRSRGQGPRGQITSSPSEDRRRLISTLMGLGSLGASEKIKEDPGFSDYSEAPLPNYSKFAITDPNNPGERYKAAPNPPDTSVVSNYDPSWANPAFQLQTGYKKGSPKRGCKFCNFNSADDALVAAYCDTFYADSAENNNACGRPGVIAPWLPGGSRIRGLPDRGQATQFMVKALAKKLGKTYEEVKKDVGDVKDTLSPGGGAAPGDKITTKEQVAAVYRQVVGCEPTPQRVDDWFAVATSRGLTADALGKLIAGNSPPESQFCPKGTGRGTGRDTGRPPAAGESSNTGLIIGGVALLGVAAFFAMRK